MAAKDALMTDTYCITMVAALGRPELRVRLGKIICLYRESGFASAFWGWDRTGDEASADGSSRILMVGGGYGNVSLRRRYLLWVYRVFLHALREEPSIVHALGFESALPLALRNKVTTKGRRSKIVFDDADRFSASRQLPRPVIPLIRRLERWVVRQSTVHIVPSAALYEDGLDGARSVVLQNTPSRRMLAQAMELDVTKPLEAEFLIYANGLIADERGAGVLDSLAAHFEEDESVGFVVAGQTTGDAAERFIARKNVRYLGIIANHEALALYRATSVVITYYDPRREANRRAGSNKWGDCLATRTPFIVNTEVETAAGFIEAGAAFGVPYNDFSALVDLIEVIRRDDSALKTARIALDTLAQQAGQDFDRQFANEVIARLRPRACP